MKQKKLWILGVAVLLVVSLLATLFVSGRRDDSQEAEIPDIAIETPCATLYYPGKWQDQIQVKVDQSENITVSFFGMISDEKEAHLFDVILGEPDTESLGVVKTKDGDHYNVGICVYEPDSNVIQSDSEMYLFDALQEDLNYLIERLPLEEKEGLSAPKSSVALVQIQRPEVYADVEVDTPYGPIIYSGDLAGQLYLDIQQEEPYAITFCWNGENAIVPLYKLTFGDEEGSLQGYLSNTGDPVFLTVFDLTQNSELREEEQDKALAVQESLNEVISNLQLQAEGGWLQFDTPYGVLCYPGENQKYLRVETVEEENYKVRFLFVRDSGEEVSLFDIVFGDTVGIPVGRYTGDDGMSIQVNLVTYDPAFNETWNEQERDLYYMMAEMVNFLLEKYEEMHSFEFA